LQFLSQKSIINVLMRSRTYLVTFLVSVFLAPALFFLEHNSPHFQFFNLKGRDLYFQIRRAFSQPPSESNEILLISIDDESLKRLEKSWPFPRSIYVEALDRLKSFAPKVVGFDFIFSGKDLVPSNDLRFSEALKEAGNVVIASHQSSAGEIGPQSLIGSNAWRVGIVDKPRDPDHVIRRCAFYFSVSGTIFPSWETAVFNKAFSKSLSAGLSSNFVIDYRLKPEDFSVISFWRLLEGSVLANELRNKIILIGPTAEVFHDIHQTPLGQMPGIAINANVLVMLIRGSLFSFPQRKFVLLFNFFSIWFVLLTSFTRSLRKGFWLVCLLIGFYLGVGYWAFLHYKLADFWFLIVTLWGVFITAHLFQSGKTEFLKYQLKKESARDPLSGFYTEKFLKLKLRLESNQTIVLLMIQTDQWRGSTETNRIISEASQILRLSVRKDERVCRYEDLFVIILPGSQLNDAGRFAEKIVRMAKGQPFTFTIAVVAGKGDLLEKGQQMLDRSRGGSQVIV